MSLRVAIGLAILLVIAINSRSGAIRSPNDTIDCLPLLLAFVDYLSEDVLSSSLLFLPDIFANNV